MRPQGVVYMQLQAYKKVFLQQLPKSQNDHCNDLKWGREPKKRGCVPGKQGQLQIMPQAWVIYQEADNYGLELTDGAALIFFIHIPLFMKGSEIFLGGECSQKDAKIYIAFTAHTANAIKMQISVRGKENSYRQ